MGELTSRITTVGVDLAKAVIVVRAPAARVRSHRATDGGTLIVGVMWDVTAKAQQQSLLPSHQARQPFVTAPGHGMIRRVTDVPREFAGACKLLGCHPGSLNTLFATTER
jgi:hypothetical protein